MIYFRGASVCRSGKGSSRSEGSSVQPDEAPVPDLQDETPLLGAKLARFRSLRRMFETNFLKFILSSFCLDLSSAEIKLLMTWCEERLLAIIELIILFLELHMLKIVQLSIILLCCYNVSIFLLNVIHNKLF